VKDLRVLKGIDLSRTIIVDNYVFSFSFHLDNGVPVVSFFGDQEDLELIKIMKYITHIHDMDDYRQANRE